jgi:hypothetical protein
MASLLNKLLQIEEPFGDTTERREKAQQMTEEARQQLDENLEALKVDASRIAQQALLIGGGIAGVYLLLDLMLGNDEDEVDSKIRMKPRGESPWYVKAVSGYVLTMLLGVARQRLVEFLATQHGANEEKNT